VNKLNNMGILANN